MNFSPMAVNVFAFKVNTMERASSFSFGPSQQLDFFVSTKRNQGVESMGDLAPLYLTVTNILDTDLVDSNSVKNSVF
ncbi:spore germination protein [Paenibacillus macerans]|nr:spore germination protein [Paenibacillus macerans]MCM3702353.1 spore germination protein [Paenibacillus macerans]